MNARAYNEGKLKDFAQVGVRAVDDRTLEMTLENPMPYWIDLCAFLTLAPVHLPTLEKHGGSWIKPGRLVGNGPFLLERWRLDDRIRAEKKSPLLGRGERADEHRGRDADRAMRTRRSTTSSPARRIW